MTFEQFKYYLDVYGASFHRWPAALRREAEAFVDSSPAAAAARAEAGSLDRLLDSYAPARDRAAEARVMARVATRAASAPAAGRGLGAVFDLGCLRLQGFWPRAAALAVVALLGIVTGVVQVARAPVETAMADLPLVALSDSSVEVAGL